MEPDSQPRIDPAPALTRGLRLLGILDREGSLTLDQLYAATRWPKSSILRLLESLEAVGAVQRESSGKRYRAIMRLVLGSSMQDHFYSSCLPHITRLSSEVRQTVEFYLYENGRLTMKDRYVPEEAEVQVRARIGWSQKSGEWDALNQLVLAFDPKANVRPAFYWNSKGEKTSVTARKVSAMVKEVRKEGLAVDPGVNRNSVQRYAAPFFSADGRLLAVLAIARFCRPGDAGIDRKLERQLRGVMKKIRLNQPDHARPAPRS